jgi:uncharacterized protein (DUF58 family)
MTPRASRSRSGGRHPARRGRLRPLRPVMPIASAFAVVFSWQLVAHNSGAGWVQALGDVVCGTLVLGLLAPGVVCARARLHVTDAPRNGTAGLPVEIVVVATTRLRVTPLDPSGAAQLVGPSGAALRRSAPTDTVVLVPARRGVYHAVTLRVATAAPFGFMWWARTVVVILPADMHIGPRLGVALSAPAHAEDADGDTRQRVPADIGEPRGVRPYRPGDNRRWVHWPATAHRGELAVREMEGPAADPVTLTVELPLDVDAAETLAERALGTVVALLDVGVPVVLETDESSVRRVAAVNDRLTAARRLARAVGTASIPSGGITTMRS